MSQVEYTLDQITASTFMHMAQALWALKNDGSRTMQLVESVDGALKVAVSSEALQMRQMRSAVVDAAADCPASIFNAANVLAATYKWDISGGGLTTVQRALFKYQCSQSAWNAAAGAGPVCQGFLITVNPDDATQANTRLTQTDFTSGATATAYAADTFIVSDLNPILAIQMPPGYYITSVYAVPIPAGFTPTNIVPARLELQVYG